MTLSVNVGCVWNLCRCVFYSTIYCIWKKKCNNNRERPLHNFTPQREAAPCTRIVSSQSRNMGKRMEAPRAREAGSARGTCVHLYVRTHARSDGASQASSLHVRPGEDQTHARRRSYYKGGGRKSRKREYLRLPPNGVAITAPRQYLRYNRQVAKIRPSNKAYSCCTATNRQHHGTRRRNNGERVTISARK